MGGYQTFYFFRVSTWAILKTAVDAFLAEQ